MTVIELIFSPAAILGAEMLLTNAVETLDERLDLETAPPERFHSVIWLADNKDTPAMGKTAGARTFQSLDRHTVQTVAARLLERAAVFDIFSGIVFIGFLLRETPLRVLVMIYIAFVAPMGVYLVRGRGSEGDSLLRYPPSWAVRTSPYRR